MSEQSKAPFAEPRPISVEQTGTFLGEPDSLDVTILKSDVQMLTVQAMQLARSAYEDPATPIFHQLAAEKVFVPHKEKYETQYQAMKTVIALTKEIEALREAALQSGFDPRGRFAKLFQNDTRSARDILLHAESGVGSTIVPNPAGFATTFYTNRQKDRLAWHFTYWDIHSKSQPVEFEKWTYVLVDEIDGIEVTYKKDGRQTEPALIDPRTENGMQHLRWLHHYTGSFHRALKNEVYNK